MKNLKILVGLVFVVNQAMASAVIPTDCYQINYLMKQVTNLSLAEKIDNISAYFLGKRAEFEPLGEGKQGEYSQRPLYDLNNFACQTYIETVMALALSHNCNEFIDTLDNIRYKDRKISFVTRNHFAVIDWIPNNEKNNYIADITTQVAGNNNVKQANVTIKLRLWYEHLNPARIMLPEKNFDQSKKILDKLHAEGQQQINKTAIITYIPIGKLLNPQLGIINRIPSGTIVMLLRDHWPNKNEFGTYMLISHMMFAIRKNNILYLRMASSYGGDKHAKIQDVPIVEYLDSYHHQLLGVSIYEVKDNKNP